MIKVTTEATNMSNSHDMYNKPCQKCGKGKYVETSINDDWDGVLHCNLCGHETKRYPVVSKGKKRSKKVKNVIQNTNPSGAYDMLVTKQWTREQFLAWVEEIKTAAFVEGAYEADPGY
jgi:uncharacterized Zn finger protein (UPF0148 family)